MAGVRRACFPAGILDRMTKFGMVCPPAIGHLNPMAAIALELRRRGPRVTLFGVPDAVAKVARLDLDVVEIGATDYPRGSIDAAYRTLGRLSGKEGLEFSINFFRREGAMLFREAPQAIVDAGIEALIIDQLTPSVATIADHLQLPFITVCNALPVNREPAVPPYFTPWAYSPEPWARLRNRLGNALHATLTRRLWHDLVQQRRRWNLPPYRKRDDAYSPYAQIAQIPRDLDFPRERLPAHFHYLGRFHEPSGLEPLSVDSIDFPWQRLDGRPLIHASLGTLQNQRPELFQCIARACAPLEAQLVLSLGDPQAPPLDLPGDPVVVPFAPHQKLIERSRVVVTHGGMNTVLTALGCGVPLVAMPITNEQPGIAARVARSGAGRALRLGDLDDPTIQAAIAEVLSDSGYRTHARRLGMAMETSGGVAKAAEILETVARTHRPVSARH